MKRIIFIFFLFLNFLPCLFSDDIDDAIMVLEINDISSIEDGDRIQYIQKVNMGIQSGINWLVVWSSGSIICYSIDNNKIISRFCNNINFEVNKYSQFDIMKNIHGTRIGNSSCLVGDYNNDSFDEVLNLAFGGSRWSIEICGYDSKKNEFVWLADIPFDIIDREFGPSPVEFITYKGMEGFKVYYVNPEVVDGPNYISSPDTKNNKWIFYTWDNSQRRFVEVEEVKEDENEWINDNSILQSTEELIKVEDNIFNQESAMVQNKTDSSSLPLPLLLAIIIGVAVGVVVVLVLRKKK